MSKLSEIEARVSHDVVAMSDTNAASDAFQDRRYLLGLVKQMATTLDWMLDYCSAPNPCAEARALLKKLEE